MGGFIIQKYLETHDSPGGVLLSSPSPTGLLPTVLRSARRQPQAFARSSLTFSLKPTIATPQMARESFFSDALPDEQIREYWAQMQEESYRALLDMVALDLPRPAKVKAPLLILGAGLDNMLQPREIEATARVYHTHAQIMPGVGHDSMLEPGWRSVAERILAWLQERENAAHPQAVEPAGVLVQ
jgi:alpha-beta hydrolase superfamily lysophospholipase